VSTKKTIRLHERQLRVENAIEHCKHLRTAVQCLQIGDLTIDEWAEIGGDVVKLRDTLENLIAWHDGSPEPESGTK